MTSTMRTEALAVALPEQVLQAPETHACFDVAQSVPPAM
jgi:hypothetical protein